MLKIYQVHAHSGGSVDLWEENWQTAEFNNGLRFCRIDPLRPLFEEYAKEGMLMLEGGCGIGQYVTFYSEKGVKVVGLDFAQQALNQLNRRVSGLRLCAGNVAALPFKDESFDLYYSGGVVEHFEDGAETSLLEAHRILKQKGVLLISVPYYSPLRRLLTPFRTNVWKRVRESKSEGKPDDGLNFFQYAYQAPEFSIILEDVGFEIVRKQGYAVLWGLNELPFLAQKSEIQNAGGGQTSPPEEKPDLTIIDQPVSQGLLKRLIVSEDDTIPLLGLGVRFMRWAAANMMMYVCVRK